MEKELQLECLHLLDKYNVNITWLKHCFEYQDDEKGLYLYNTTYEPSTHWREQLDLTQYRLLKEVLNIYYVYLYHPYGISCIGSGTLKHCQEIKAKKDAEWKTGYMWSTEILDHQIETYDMWD